jgi:UrcA family protein
MKKPIRFATLAAAACLAAPAFATSGADTPDSVDVRSTKVSYNTAEIRDAAALERLFFRIRLAAEEVCRTNGNTRGVEIWIQHNCEADAVVQAVRASGIPALQQYYFGPAQRPMTASR